MTVTKSNRIFLGVATVLMAAAGTGLTLVNNWNVTDVQVCVVAIMLAACFSFAETMFLWAHKRFESSVRLWRKILLGVTLVILVSAMSLAFWEELKTALHKISNRGFADNSAQVVSSANKKLQLSLGRTAIKELSNDKLKIDPTPFVLCYLIAGLSSIMILAATEKPKKKTQGQGNLLASDPTLAQRVQETYGVNPQMARAYLDRNGKGASIWHQSKQIGYLKFENQDHTPRVYDPADNRKNKGGNL